MRRICLFSAIAVFVMSGSVFAQHSDVEFGYDNLAAPSIIDIEVGEVTSENIALFESGFEELDPGTPGDFSSDEPGFATNAAEGLLVNAGDQIFLNAVDASAHSSFGVGFVNYYNPATNKLEASGRLSVIGNPFGGAAPLVLDGASVESGLTNQFLGLGDALGDVHDHVVIDLLDDGTAPLGAYGIMFELQADFATGDGTPDAFSDKFWIVWNHGMSEEHFENRAIPQFSGVPEPATATFLVMGAVGFLARRRR